MKCIICKTGDVRPGTATFTVDRDGHTYVLREVPGLVCEQCREPYFDSEVTRRVLAQVAEASRSDVEIAVLKYEAA